MLESQKEELLFKVRELEKSIHMLEAGNLEAKNQLQSSHYGKEKEIRDNALQEGFENGAASTRKDHQIEMTDLRSQHMQKLREAEAEAEARGKAIAKMEIEAQVKAFSMTIRPYVRIINKSGVFGKSYTSQMGYQYQLMVNGVPAFDPHVIIEKEEEVKEVDQEKVQYFANLALESAKTIAQVYSANLTSGIELVGSSIIKTVSAKDLGDKDKNTEKTS